ncbi:putative ankyrin repeat protein [Acanthamoeba polyphaga mimivirus]|uniref:Ankyrin repeat protein n=1 Tax=Acanthamoeba polyphaga mimivirus Kroon TaxID=3069720 RepID=A0A0G2Y3Z6_9VIRU|nr:putative ankyrin repeat protein [Acanthamoeba polyphaga mimivirus]AKI80508.1 putative ankyrin repeat protein [Acanthamoeba polyphaga mimivirus Kroon]
MESKTYYLLRTEKYDDYEIFTIVEDKYFFDNVFHFNKIIQVKPDYDRFGFKICEHEQTYLTNYIIELETYSLFDIDTVDRLIINTENKLGMCDYLYCLYIKNNRLDLCDYLIQSNYEYDPTSDCNNILEDVPDENEADIIMYIINNNNFFKIKWSEIANHVIGYTRCYDVIDYLVNLLKQIDYNVDYESIIEEFYYNQDGYLDDIPFSETIKILLRLECLNTYKLLEIACIFNVADLVTHLLDIGIEYDFNSILKNHISLNILKIFLDRGNILDDNRVKILLSNNKGWKFSQVFPYLIDEQYISQELVDKNLVDMIIDDNFPILKHLIEKFDLSELIDYDVVMKKAIMNNNLEIIDYCINNGTDVNNYMTYAFQHYNLSCFTHLLNQGGVLSIDNLIYRPENLRESKYQNIQYIDMIIDNNLDSIENILGKILDYYCYNTDIYKYVLSKINCSDIIFPELTNKIIINYYYNGGINDRYLDLAKLEINLSDICKSIIAIITDDFDSAKQLIVDNNLYDNLKILFIATMKCDIDMLKFLFEINNNSNDYLQWSLLFSLTGKPNSVKFITEDIGVKPERMKEFCFMLKNSRDTCIKYFKLNGYDVDINNEDNCDEYPVVKFFREIGIYLDNYMYVI